MLFAIIYTVLNVSTAPVAASSDVIKEESLDLELSQVEIYGYFGDKSYDYDSYVGLDGREYEIKAGEIARIKFREFDRDASPTMEFIDIEATVSNHGDRVVSDVEVTLAVRPKITYEIYIKDYPHKMWSDDDMERFAEWFSPLFVRKVKINKINANSEAIVLFDKIVFYKMIKEYQKKKLWPTEFNFEVSVSPAPGGEVTFKNNTKQTNLKIHIPFY